MCSHVNPDAFFGYVEKCYCISISTNRCFPVVVVLPPLNFRLRLLLGLVLSSILPLLLALLSAPFPGLFISAHMGEKTTSWQQLQNLYTIQSRTSNHYQFLKNWLVVIEMQKLFFMYLKKSINIDRSEQVKTLLELCLLSDWKNSRKRRRYSVLLSYNSLYF